MSLVTVFCQALYWSQFVGWHQWHEFSVFLWRGLSPLSPIGIAKKMDIYFSFHQQFAYFWSRSIHTKKCVNIYALMSYVLHFYRMTYKTYAMLEYIFVHPEEWYSRETYSSGFFVFHPLVARKWACPWRLCASSHGANHRSVFNGIRFILPKTLCP